MTRWPMGARTVWISAGLLLASLSLGCGEVDPGPGEAARNGHQKHGESEAPGPNGGRVLTSGAFELEIGIFERGNPPEYRAWARSDGRAIEPDAFALEVKLARLGGRTDLISFAPRADHLVSTSNIVEPHSFEVSVAASYEQANHAWAFESFEGRTRIDRAMADSLGVETEIAGPATLAKTATVYGRIRTNPERVRTVRARFDGVVRAVHARVGSSVRKGEKLLGIESNENLNLYSIAAPISGVVTQRDANPGEQTSGRLLLTITDTTSVWAELSVFPVDRDGVVVGSSVSIEPALGGTPVAGVISWLGTDADRHDQSVIGS